MTAPRPPRGLAEAHVVTALLCLAAAAIWIAVDPGILAGHFYTTRLMGLTHLVTLGWLSTFALGVLLRAAPQFLHTSPVGPRMGWTVYVLWVIGASGIAFHMARGEWFGVWTAGSSLAVAVGLLFLEHRAIFAKARGGDAAAGYASLAMINLALAMLLGMGIALNKHLGLVMLSPYRTLAAHIHLAAAGWLTLLVLGFGRKLLPPLSAEPRATRWRLAGFEIALLALVVSLLGPASWKPASALAASLLALVIWLHIAVPVERLFAGHVRDRASQWVSVALAVLGMNALLGAGLAWGLDEAMRGGGRLHTAYMAVTLLGWLTAVITGFALKLFPMWVWQQRFETDYGERPVPAMQDLVSRPLQTLTGILFLAGPLILAIGLAGADTVVIGVGTRLTAAGVFCFLAQFARLARWVLLKRPYHPTEDDVERFTALLRAREGEPKR